MWLAALASTPAFLRYRHAATHASLVCQAIELSTDILANVKFIQEKKLIAKCACYSVASVACSWSHALLRRYFDEISQDTGKYCFGVDDTLQCLDMGAVETLIVWENLEVCALPRVACSVANSASGITGEPPRAGEPANRGDVHQAPDS